MKMQTLAHQRASHVAARISLVFYALSSRGHWFSLMGTILPFEITTYAI